MEMIYILLTNIGIGGAEKQFLEFYKWCRKNGYPIKFICIFTDQHCILERNENIHYIFKSTPKSKIVKMLFWLFSVYKISQILKTKDSNILKTF